MRHIHFSTALTLGLLLAAPVAAETFVRTSNQYELPRDQVIDGNFLGVGNPISVGGEVTQDATLVGNRITVTGGIGADVLAVGVLSRLDGIVRGDVRVFSGNTTISGTVAGDVLVVGGSVDVLSDASIEGDLVLYTGSAIVSGAVGGKIVGTAQNLTIDGPVGASVDVYVSQLTLGSNASITESVRYTSHTLLSQSLDTMIGGTVLRNDPVYASGGFSLGAAIYPILILLFSTSVWFVLSKRTLTKLVQQTVSVLPRSAITGVVSFFVTPLIVFVLTVSLLGGYLWLSDVTSANSTFAFVVAVLPVLVVLLGYITLFMLAVIAVPAFFGQACLYITKNPRDSISLFTILIGSLICIVLLLLPVVGMFIFFFAAIILLGGLLENIIKASK